MQVRYYIDPASGQPRIYGHNADESEVEDILARALEDRPGRQGSRVALARRGRAATCE